MSLQSLKKLYEVNARALQMNLKDITHEESLVQPGGGGNCLNWVVGHIVANRNHILSLLGEPPIWGEEDYERYKRGSAPIREGGAARPFAGIVDDFVRSQERVRAGLERITEAKLAEPAGQETVGDTLAFLQFHEAYHVGQAGLLRRLAGKAGAIP